MNEWSAFLGPRTVDRTYGTLRAAFAYAIDSDLFPRSPCRNVNLPRAVPRRRPVLTPDDVGRLANAMGPNRAAMVWVGALLGLRWGEVAGLRVRDLDLSGRTLSVTEIVTRDERGRSVAGPPKSQAGTRTLSMPEELAHVLSEHFGRLGLTARDPDAYVFTTPTGKAWGYSNWRKQCWLPARTQAGLAGIGFHDLRRTAATYLVAGNVDLKTAQTRLGHSDPRPLWRSTPKQHRRLTAPRQKQSDCDFLTPCADARGMLAV